MGLAATVNRSICRTPTLLIAETFESDVGLENDTLDTADGGFVWFEVTGVEDARDLTFEEARERAHRLARRTTG